MGVELKWAVLDCSLIFSIISLATPFLVDGRIEEKVEAFLWTANTLLIGVRFCALFALAVSEGRFVIENGFVQFLVNLFTSLGLGSALLYVTIILFGAPLFQLVDRTLLVSVYLSSLCVLPFVFWQRRVSGKRKGLSWIASESVEFFVRGTCETELDELLLMQSRCAAIGAWMGAIPIPLDWDRPWQTWPVTIVYGSVIGYVFGTLLALSRAFLRFKSPQKQE